MKRALGPWLRLLIAVAVFGALVWRLGGDAVVAGFRVIDAGTVLAALGIGGLTTLCNAVRWRVIARRLGLDLPFGTALGDYYRATLLNCVLPAGMLGDVRRAVRHGRRSGDLGRGVRAVVLERLSGQVVLLVAGVVVFAAAPPAIAAAVSPGAAGWLVLAGVVLAIAGLAVWARRGRRAQRLRGAIAATAADARRGLFGVRQTALVLLLSAGALAGYLWLFVVSARAAGSSADVSTLLPLSLAALVAMSLPIGVGGWGPREAVAALAFGAAGLGAALGLTVAVVYGTLTLIAALPGAVLLLVETPAAPMAPPTPAISAPGRTQRVASPG